MGKALWTLPALVVMTAVHAGEDFKKADRDQSGRLDRQEAQQAGISDFDRYDADQNGLLSRGEYKAAQGSRERPGAAPNRGMRY